ncbi:UNVERIFIED_CONTAM: hypothetical protein RMT77_004728 [Armadillidium vulgare]
MLLYKYFGIFLLKLISIRYATAKETTCSEFLAPEHQEGIGTRGSLFQYPPSGICFLCTKKKSPEDDFSVVEIPVYNNVFDFGFSGMYFPKNYTTEIKMTEQCSLEITVTAVKPEATVSDLSIKISICAKSSKTGCKETSFSQSVGLKFYNWDCLYVAVAFVEKKIYGKITSRCQHLASSGFNENDSIDITEQECFIDDKANLQAIIKTYHSKDSKYDGFPVILPCSPGGYAVDPFTGRFAIGDQCYKFFRYLPKNIEKEGINFIIQKVYKNNENLIFPKKAKKPYDVNPAYIQDNGEPSSKEEMKAKEVKNLQKGTGTRDYCDYDYKNRTCSVEGKKNKSCEIFQCEQVLNGSNMQQQPKRDALNYYVDRNGCFLCSKPSCDFNEEGCDKTSEIKDFPLYNNMIEFGIPALHFPVNTIVKIKITDGCYYKVEIKYASQMGSIGIFECLSDKCTDLLKDSEKLEFQLSLNNYYCAYIALAFRSESEIHFATSDICKKFASVEFQSNRTLKRQKEACAFFGKNYKLSAEFKFTQDNSSTHSGVPLIVPCSTGGVLVNPYDGRFIIKAKCRKIIWDSNIREKGLEFVIDKFYDGKEDYLFKMENETNVAYPSPIYYQEDGKFIPIEEAVPKEVPNEKFQGKYRKGCYYPPSQEKQEKATKTEDRSTKRTTVEKEKKEKERPTTSKEQERVPPKRQAPVATPQKQRTNPPANTIEDERTDDDSRSAPKTTSEASYATFDIMILLFVGFALTL